MRKNSLFNLKYLFIFCLLTVTLLTSGCVKYTYRFDIDNKGKIAITETNGISSSIMKEMNPTVLKILNDGINLKTIHKTDNGYSVYKCKDGDYAVLKSYKKFNISRFITADLPEGFSTPQKNPVMVQKKFYKTTYTISLSYNIKYATRNIMDNAGVNFGLLNENVEPVYNKKPVAELIIKIPTKAISNNANQIVGKNEYKWFLLTKKTVNIELKYEIINWFNIILSIIVAVTTILLIIAMNNKEFSKKSPLDWF